jgi:hypothetical protein
MKYFLVLGIEYKKYKKPAHITVYVGEKFIDTFQLDRDFLCTTDVLAQIDTKWYEKHGRPEWLKRPDWTDTWKRHKLPTYFKVYELDDNNLEGKLTIKVDNSNTDFTNGFMKNCSLIRLAIPALVKKESVAGRGEKIIDDLIKSEAEMFVEGEKSNHLMKNKRWPVADLFTIVRDKHFPGPSEQGDRWWWIGGSFTAEFEIVKRHDTKYLGLLRDDISGKRHRTIHPDDLVVASWTKLLNIYDENQ